MHYALALRELSQFGKKRGTDKGTKRATTLVISLTCAPTWTCVRDLLFSSTASPPSCRGESLWIQTRPVEEVDHPCLSRRVESPQRQGGQSDSPSNFSRRSVATATLDPNPKICVDVQEGKGEPGSGPPPLHRQSPLCLSEAPRRCQDAIMPKKCILAVSGKPRHPLILLPFLQSRGIHSLCFLFSHASS